MAAKLTDARDFFFLGRHVGYPVALEGALKLKELAYLRAEGYPAGELKHGPIALIEPGTVVVGIADAQPVVGEDAVQHRRGAQPRRHGRAGGRRRRRGVRRGRGPRAVGPARRSRSWLPVVGVVPLQQLAYRLARLHGHDPDRPRNLAKTVTVE